MEANIGDPLCVPNEILNNNITLDEIYDIATHAKSHSASGYDEIPYTVLKYPIIIETLHTLFQVVFEEEGLSKRNLNLPLAEMF